MKIFVLEDDPNAMTIREWLIRSGHSVRLVTNLLDATYYLEYEPEAFDGLIFDVNVPGATVEHADGRTVRYDDPMNGIRFLLENGEQPWLKKYAERIALYTAYKHLIEVSNFPSAEQAILRKLPKLDKTSDKLIMDLEQLLDNWQRGSKSEDGSHAR